MKQHETTILLLPDEAGNYLPETGYDGAVRISDGEYSTYMGGVADTYLSVMKKSILLLLLSLAFYSCQAQDVKTTSKKKQLNVSFVNNKKLKYTIIISSCDTCAPITNIGYRALVDLSKKQTAIVKKIEPSTWLKLLNDNESDFAANLILYNLYDKDAFLLARNDTKELWDKSIFKKEDLEYWNNLLKRESTK